MVVGQGVGTGGRNVSALCFRSSRIVEGKQNIASKLLANNLAVPYLFILRILLSWFINGNVFVEHIVMSGFKMSK